MDRMLLRCMDRSPIQLTTMTGQEYGWHAARGPVTISCHVIIMLIIIKHDGSQANSLSIAVMRPFLLSEPVVITIPILPLSPLPHHSLKSRFRNCPRLIYYIILKLIYMQYMSRKHRLGWLLCSRRPSYNTHTLTLQRFINVSKERLPLHLFQRSKLVSAILSWFPNLNSLFNNFSFAYLWPFPI